MCILQQKNGMHTLLQKAPRLADTTVFTAQQRSVSQSPGLMGSPVACYPSRNTTTQTGFMLNSASCPWTGSGQPCHMLSISHSHHTNSTQTGYWLSGASCPRPAA